MIKFNRTTTLNLNKSVLSDLIGSGFFVWENPLLLKIQYYKKIQLHDKIA